jgi:hypothetical protein
MSFPHTLTPPDLNAHETDTLEFKCTVENLEGTGKVDRFELAKDVAGLANAQGGTIIVGAYGGSTVKIYKPCDESTAKRVAREYEEAVRDRCRPSPQVSCGLVAHGEGSLVFVHVLPHPFPVAVQVRGDKTDGYGDPAWVFFSRVASQTQPFSPELLPMLTPDVRRIALLLRSIPQDGHVILSQQAVQGTSTATAGCRMVRVQEETNAFVLRWPTGGPNNLRSFPLDMVRTMYRRADEGAWCIDLGPYHHAGG